MRWRLLAAAAALAFSTLVHAATPVADMDAATDAIAVERPPIGTLALDTGSATTDLSTNVPTSWWFYTGISAAQVTSYLTANGARLTDIEVQSVTSGVPTFTVRMVQQQRHLRRDRRLVVVLRADGRAAEHLPQRQQRAADRPGALRHRRRQRSASPR